MSNEIGTCRRSLLVMVLIFACLVGSTVHAAEAANDIDHTTSARKGEDCSPCVLILFLYDLNKQWHVVRAATYKSLDACKIEGNRVNQDMKREIDKQKRVTTNFYCLREGL